MRLRTLSGHEDLRVHPDREIACLDADYGAHAGHAVGSNGDNFSGAHETSIDAVPLPMSSGVALTRRRSPIASKPSADKMVLGKKPLKIFVCRPDVTHGYSPFKIKE